MEQSTNSDSNLTQNVNDYKVITRATSTSGYIKLIVAQKMYIPTSNTTRVIWPYFKFTNKKLLKIKKNFKKHKKHSHGQKIHMSEFTYLNWIFNSKMSFSLMSQN